MFIFLIASSFSLVAEITAENIDNYLGENPHPPVFLAIVSRWCGHCLEMKPEWLELSQKYENDTSLIIATIDLEAQRPLVSRFESFSGTPSIYWVPTTPKNARSYGGDRHYSDFVQYIEKMFQPPIISIENHTDFANHLLNQEKFSLFFIQGDITPEYQQIFVNAVNAFDLCPIHIFHLKYQEFKVPEPYLANFVTSTWSTNVFRGKWDNSSIFDFIDHHKFPPLADATMDFITRCVKDKYVKKFVLYQDSSDPEDSYIKNITKMTLSFPGIPFGNIVCENNMRACQLFGLNYLPINQIVVVEPKWNLYYPYFGEFEDRQIKRFIQRAIAGRGIKRGPGAGFSGYLYNFKLFYRSHSTIFIVSGISIVLVIFIAICICCFRSKPKDTSIPIPPDEELLKEILDDGENDNSTDDNDNNNDNNNDDNNHDNDNNVNKIKND